MNLEANATIEELRAGLGIRVKEAKEKDGKKVVGCFCSYFPRELVWAADAIPIGLCGNTEKPIEVAEKVLPRDLCPTVKATYGHAISGKCPLFYLADCLIGESTCDGRQKMYELMGREKPMLVMDLPKMQDEEAALVHWIAEIKKLKEFLETQLETTITEQKIREVIRDTNKERRLLKAIHGTRKRHPVPITALDLLGVLTKYGYSRVNHQDRIKDLESILGLIEERARNNFYACSPDAPRVMWSGLGSSWGSDKVLRLIEECGGIIVCEEGCSGVTRIDDFVDEEKDPIIALAERYLRINCACMSPNSTRLKQIERLLEEYTIDGIVNFTRQFCALYDIESTKVKELVVGKFGIPYIHIISDFSTSDIEQLKVRIEGFMEKVWIAKRKQMKK